MDVDCTKQKVNFDLIFRTFLFASFMQHKIEMNNIFEICYTGPVWVEFYLG